MLTQAFCTPTSLIFNQFLNSCCYAFSIHKIIIVTFSIIYAGAAVTGGGDHSGTELKMTATSIHYVNAGAGSGKTHQLIGHAATLVRTQKAKVLIAQPTKVLILQTLAEIQSQFPNVAAQAIYNAGDGKPIMPEIVEHMKQADPHVGQILLITHEALKRLPNAYRVHWDLFVDEIPAVFENVSLRVAKTHNHLTDLLDLEDITDKVAAVKIREGSKSQMEALRVPA